jgi:hypothetical protein
MPELTTAGPTTEAPTTGAPTALPTARPSTGKPTARPTTFKPTARPTTLKPTARPTTLKPTREPTTRAPTKAPTTKAFAYCQAKARATSAKACADKSGLQLCRFNYEYLPGVAVDPTLPANTCWPSAVFHPAAAINAASYRQCVAPTVIQTQNKCIQTRGCFWNSATASGPLLPAFAVQCLPNFVKNAVEYI